MSPDRPENGESADGPEDARVRALLAELGAAPEGEPLPPAVAARLDDTLAQLVAERRQAAGTGATGTGAAVVPLRRRRAPLLVAAAAGIVVATGAGVVVGELGAPGTDSAVSSQDSRPAPGSTEDRGGSGESGGSSEPGDADTTGGVAALSTRSFAREVTALLARAELSTPQRRVPPPAAVLAESCRGPADTDAAATPVRLDGRPAALLVHGARTGERLVEAWTCAGDRRLASARVPVR